MGDIAAESTEVNHRKGNRLKWWQDIEPDSRKKKAELCFFFYVTGIESVGTIKACPQAANEGGPDSRSGFVTTYTHVGTCTATPLAQSALGNGRKRQTKPRTTCSSMPGSSERT